MILVQANMTYRMKRNRSINYDSIRYAGLADNKRVKITPIDESATVNNPNNLSDDEMSILTHLTRILTPTTHLKVKRATISHLSKICIKSQNPSFLSQLNCAR